MGKMAAMSFYPRLTMLLLCLILGQVLTTTPISINSKSFSNLLVQNALTSLNQDSPTKHTYRSGNLVFAQILVERPFVVYRISLVLEPNCDEGSLCLQEICTLDIKQQGPEVQDGNLVVDSQSKRCKYVEAASSQDTNQISPESTQDLQEQEIIDSLDKQIINDSVNLDHEIQRVTDQNDKPFIAVRSSHYCPGCPYELNPTHPGLEPFAEVVLKSLDDVQSNVFKHKIDNVIRVTRAIPVGLDVARYELLIKIGETECFKSSPIPRSECAFQSNKPLMICLAVFDERPWLLNSRQMIRNNCTEYSDNYHQPELTGELLIRDNEHAETQEEEIKPIVHDQVAQEGQISSYESTIDESLQVPVTKIEAGYQESERPEITEVPFKEVVLKKEVDVEKKPIKGFTDKIKEFDAFLEDFDIPIKTTTPSAPIYQEQVNEEIIRPEKVESKYSQKESDPSVESSRKRRSLRSEHSFTLKLAQKAMNYLDDIDKDDKKRVIADVLDSKKVEGKNGITYHITVLSASTNCPERQKSVKNCIHESSEPLKVCKIQINTEEVNPFDTAKVIKTQCFDKREKRLKRDKHLVGAPEHISVNDTDIMEYVNKGLKKYSAEYKGTNEPILVQVVKATRQVVAGTLDKITVKIGESNCPKGQASNTCLLVDNSPIKECVIEAWSRPWLKKLEITVKCHDSRRKRSLRGRGYSTKMLSIAADLKYERDFALFQAEHDRKYSSEEEKAYRFEVFKSNMKIAERFQETEQGTAIYGASMFADMTSKEFRRYTGLRQDFRSENEIPLPNAKIPDIELPDKFDWRDYNAVTPVKNQGSCGSCWAFSVTGNIEGQYAIKHGKLLSLSEQELVDCDKIDEGCNGGLQENAYRALEEIGGIELENDYPYDGEDEKCHFKKNKVAVNVVSAVNITSNETQMAQYLVKNGPMAIGINANAMQFYMGGISHPWSFLCNKNSLDHGVLIVGYGVTKYPLFKKVMPYWLVKNSWGPTWGEKGYYRVYRGDGTCGVNTDVSSAIVA